MTLDDLANQYGRIS